MVKKSLWRATPTQKAYDNHKKNLQQATHGCDFCLFASGSSEVLRDNGSVWLVKNIFPYDNWDGYYVDDHLLIVPKRHIESIADFTDEEMLDFARLVREYEADGYSVYARPPRGGAKSVPHQHTHLLKLGQTELRHVSFDRRLNHRLVR